MMTVQTVKLGDVAKITTGKTPSKSDKNNFGGRIPFVNPPHLGKYGFVMKTEEYLSSQGQAYANIIPQNSVMVSCIGSLGKVGIAGVDLATNQQINSLTFDAKKVDYKYGYYFCLTLKRKLDEIANKAVVPIVNKTTFSNLDFLLPPLETQKRIVARLDAADQLRRKRNQAIALLDDYLKAVFLEMFGDPVVNPKGFKKVSIEEFGKVVTGNTPSRKQPSNFGNFIEWIKSDNINNKHHYVTTSKEHLSEEGAKKGRIVPKGSILVTCIAGSLSCIGNVGMVDRDVAFNQQINAIEPHDDVNQIFLYSQILFSKKVFQGASTNSMKGMLSKSNFSKIELIMPDIVLQKQFAGVFLKIEKLKQSMLMQSEEFNINFNALMQGAFNT